MLHCETGSFSLQALTYQRSCAISRYSYSLPSQRRIPESEAMIGRSIQLACLQRAVVHTKSMSSHAYL